MSEGNLDHEEEFANHEEEFANHEEEFANSTRMLICRGGAAALIVLFCSCWYECNVDKYSSNHVEMMDDIPESTHVGIVDDTSESDRVETVDDVLEYSSNDVAQRD